MANSIDVEAVSLSLMLEAMKLLDRPEHAAVVRHLQNAIDELSLQQRRRVSSAFKEIDADDA